MGSTSICKIQAHDKGQLHSEYDMIEYICCCQTIHLILDSDVIVQSKTKP